MRVRLLPSASIEAAANLLDTLGHNVYGEAMPVGSSLPADVRDTYVRWALSAERQLAGIIERRDVSALIDSPRHRDICTMPAGSQLVPLISAEVETKSKDLMGLAEELRAAQRRMGGDRCPAILDTNVFLHFQRPDSVKWNDIIGEPARLIIPLRVLEELDTKKYGANRPEVRQSARDVLSWLEGCFVNSTHGPVGVAPSSDVTMELYLGDQPRWRPTDADEEILDVCQEVRLLAKRAKLITGDKGFRLRARALGVDVCLMPDSYLRRSQ